MTPTVIGSLLALAAALSWAAANMAIKPATERLGPWVALVWAQLLGVLLALPIALAVDGLPSALLDDSAARDTLLPLLVAAPAAALAYGGLFAALDRGKVSSVVPIVSSWVLISVAVDLFRSQRAPSLLLLVGLALVLIGNTTLARSEGSGSQPEPESRSEPKPKGPPAIVWACLSALGFGLQVPAVDALGESLGRAWTIPAVWSAELLLLVPVLLALGLLSARPRSGHEWWLVARTATWEVGGFFALSLALGLAPIAVVSPIASLMTAFSVLLGVFLLRERLTPPMRIAVLCASVGIVLVNF